jgi:alcohol dehydrogenase/propanol-preferring alcohol dehydrogenase
VGSPSTATLAFDSLARGGKLVMVGLFGGAAPWSLPLIPMKAVTIAGSYTGNLSETKELLDLVGLGVVPNIPIQRREVSEAAEALEDLKAGRIVGRVVLTP